MKLTILLGLLCLGVCFAAGPKVTLWGTETQNLLGSKKIKVDSSFLQVKEYTFSFPEDGIRFPIYGIKHYDFKSHPVTVRFLKGDIGDYNVTIHITSQRNHGINSEFLFFT